MANAIVKTATYKPAKPQAAASSSAAAAPESKPNSGSKPNSLVGSALKPVTADRRRAMIAEAAYYIAEQRGFGAGNDVEDWLLAEKQVDAALST